MKIENHFGIEIPDKVAAKIETVGDLHDVVFQFSNAPQDKLAEIQNTVNLIIAEHAGIDLKEILPEKRITRDLGLD